MKKLMFSLLSLMLLASCNNEEIISDTDQTATKTRTAVNSGSPVDSVSGLIDINYFGIRMSPHDSCAQSNAKGISDAIQWAADRGLKKVTLPTGTYIIDSPIIHLYEQMRFVFYGIKVLSDIDFDLNGSTIIQKTTSEAAYALIYTRDASNVKIHNGKLLGDRLTHDYSDGKTHEGGVGVLIQGGNNVLVFDMDISEMTGDAIGIQPHYPTLENLHLHKGAVLPTNVKITDSELHNCRRQGMSILGVDGIEVCNNRIHSIGGTNGVSNKYGTAPQSCIDIEPESDWVVENIHIHNNYLQSNAGIGCIMYSRIQDIVFDSNTLDSCSVGLSFNSPPINDKGIKCTISNNTLIVKKDGTNIGINAVSHNEFKGEIDYIRIVGNKLGKASIMTGGHESLKNIYVQNNEITNSRLHLVKSSGQKVSGNVLKQGYILASDLKNTVFRDNTIENTDLTAMAYNGFTLTRSENTVVYNNTFKNTYFALHNPKKIAYFSNSFSATKNIPYYALHLTWNGDPSEYYLYVMYNEVDGNYLGAEPNSINKITVNRNEIDCENFIRFVESNFTKW